MAQRFAASPSILTFMADSPNYGNLSSTSAMERAKNEATNLMGNARIHGAGITGRANKKIAKHRGAAAVAQGRAEGHAAMMGGIADGFGSIIGGIGRMPKGGGSGPGKMATLDSTPMTVENAYGSSVSYYDPNIYTGVGDY